MPLQVKPAQFGCHAPQKKQQNTFEQLIQTPLLYPLTTRHALKTLDFLIIKQPSQNPPYAHRTLDKSS